MTAITNPVEGLKAIQNFLMNRVAPTPDEVREKLLELIDPTQQTSPVQAAVDAAEFIYAKREGEGEAAAPLPPELLEIGAQLATMLAGHKLFGMHIDNRGYAIAATIREMPSVASAPPPAAELVAPEPEARYMPPAEPEIVPEATGEAQAAAEAAAPAPDQGKRP